MSTSRSKRFFLCANKRATNHAEARRLQAVCENCDMSHQTRILDGGTNLLHSETGIWLHGFWCLYVGCGLSNAAFQCIMNNQRRDNKEMGESSTNHRSRPP
ncbi:hypothetical protein NPIL_71291 [Nephila pilipes]|uniref:Uncharacterized protein n=1 Tax=Nephila pilipes TaxID=299642 RepID=A0A8X6TMK8_NEPPI|nr:hypothetical protein NPIL_71291 [Nephila pilipes]